MIEQKKDGCVYASLAMVLGEKLETIEHNFKCWSNNFPFSGEWEKVPRVPGMHEICEVAIRHFKTAFVPFEYDPEVTPHEDCKPIKVWGDRPERVINALDAREMFLLQLSRGPGLIEGVNTGNGRGHMVAWNGQVVFDPRDYCYSINVTDKFYFNPLRFWLAVSI